MRRRALLAVVWTVAGLALIDIAVNLLFAYPEDPKATSASQFQLYFEYGRSTEGKLARVTRASREDTAPITLAGWYDPLVVVPPRPPSGPIVSFYGMSHAVRLSEAFDRVSNRYSSRSIGAPGATANWAFGAFLRDEEVGDSRAAVLSIMSLTTPMITTLSAMTWNSAFPLPYTSDRFLLAPNGLSVVHPPYSSFENYVDSFQDPRKWRQASSYFKRHDPMYDPVLMRETMLDRSTIVRLMRRAYGQRVERLARERVLDRNGFDAASEEIRVANEIVRQFAAESRRRGVIPIVYIINNLGYSDHLYQALRTTLVAEDIPHLSSHMFVSPSDPRGYLPDTHFTDANDDLLAKALERLIDAESAEAASRRAALPSRRN